MTQEEKQLLLKDLCGRLPYGVKFQGEDSNVYTLDAANYFALQVEDMVFKPYLRPMSSMTDKERKEFQAFHCVDALHPYFYQQMCNLQNLENMFNWLNKKMFDYRGLIPMGLAIEAPEDMYKYV